MKRYFDFLFGVPLQLFLSLFKGGKKPLDRVVKKVLIIKLAAVGDTILLRSVLKSLREALPAATLQWLVSKNNDAVAKMVPYVNEVIVMPGPSVFPILSLVRRLRNEHFDVIVDLEQWARGTGILSFMAGAPVRLGFRSPGQWRHRLYSHSFAKKYDDHELFDFYGLFSLWIPLKRSRKLDLQTTPEGEEEWSRVKKWFIKEPFPALSVVMHPGCGRDGGPREWPLTQYGLLANWLINKYQAQIILTSGPEEAKKTADLNKLLSGKGIDVGGQLTWPGLISLVRDVDLVISGNTGIMHVAAALEKKQVALHGPTDPRLWGPLNPWARVVQTSCSRCPCLKLGFEYHTRDQSCMKKIGLTDVKQAVGDLIDKSG